MSEYQYYEFLAIDRPLTASEQRVVRGYSSRAQITAASFTNTYDWGDFKGDPLQFVVDWYDAHVYFANWGTHRFMFRVAMDLIDLELARACCGREGSAASLTVRDGWAIFDLCLEPDDGPDYDDDDGSPWMALLTPARAELLRGDPRLLYFAWLYRVQFGEVSDDEPEPFLPPGLGAPSPSLMELAEFLQLDAELLDVAAELSEAPESDGAGSDAEFAGWIKGLPGTEKDELLVTLCRGDDASAAARLRRRFESTRPQAEVKGGRRTARQLRDATERLANQRRTEAEGRARQERAAKAARAAAERNRYLDELATREAGAWREVAARVSTKKPKEYDEAVSLLRDLHDLAARSNQLTTFTARLQGLRAEHASKRTFLDRLHRANL